MAVLGSNPEFGSSQKRYLGLFTMALAMATRFCIPPEASLGILEWASIRLTRFNTASARSCISLSF